MTDKLTPDPTPTLKDGEPCGHPGCLSHVSHPCEKCGRIMARFEKCPKCGLVLVDGYHRVTQDGGCLMEGMVISKALLAEIRAKDAEIERLKNLRCSCDEDAGEHHPDCILMVRETNRAMVAEIERLKEALTPSGETKAEYAGEFYFSIEDGDEDGEELQRTVDVPWTTIKLIMKKILERANRRV